MTDKLNISKAREIYKRGPNPNCYSEYHEAYGYIQAWEEQEKKIQEQGRTIKDFWKACSDLYDIQDHEDWCGHGKAGCLMCKVIEKIFTVLSTVPEEYRGG